MLVSEDIELLYNRDGHGLAYNELVETLCRLFERGDLVVKEVYKKGASSNTFTPSLAEIEVGLNGTYPPHGLYYGLTPQGGQKWEELSKPEWHRFLDGSSTLRPRKTEYISINHDLTSLAMQMELESGFALKEAPVWKEVSPWQATPWKILPFAHSVSYITVPLKGNQNQRKIWDETDLRNRKLLLEMTEWYTPAILEI